jgi:hypothetical protein
MRRFFLSPFRRLGQVLDALFPPKADDFGERLLLDLGLKR